MDRESDDPEEQRRKMEAKAAAENFGAAIGLVAGMVIVINEQHKLPDESAMEQTM